MQQYGGKRGCTAIMILFHQYQTEQRVFVFLSWILTIILLYNLSHINSSVISRSVLLYRNTELI